MNLHYYNEFVEDSKGNEIVGSARIDISKYGAMAGSKVTAVYDWAGHGHFDGTEYGMRAKLDLLYGRPTEIQNTAEQGYISAKMCLAAQESIETGKVVNLDLAL